VAILRVARYISLPAITTQPAPPTIKTGNAVKSAQGQDT
jgi:hypothetical protein